MASIESILLNQVKRSRTPSLQYILFDKDNIIKRFSAGLADIKENKQAAGNTSYHAFSVTKTFTALAIMQLAEKGKLDITKPAGNYLPEFPFGAEITIQQLLSHSAGIPNPIPLSWIHLVDEHGSFDRNLFFSKIFARNKKVKAGPNEKFAYSNLGYVLLGQLIEGVSGISYEDYIKENIIDKLGIVPDELGFTIMNSADHAKGYIKKASFTNLILGLFLNKAKFMGPAEGKWKPFLNYYLNGASYGGLIGTPDAFVRYIQEMLRDDCRLLSKGSKKMLFTENITNNNKASGMCLSWFTRKLNGHQYFAHAGGGGGYYAEVRIYPDIGIGSVIFFNRTGMSDENFLDKVDRYYFENLVPGTQ